MQFSWRWDGGTIFLNLGVIWEMSIETAMGVIGNWSAQFDGMVRVLGEMWDASVHDFERTTIYTYLKLPPNTKLV